MNALYISGSRFLNNFFFFVNLIGNFEGWGGEGGAPGLKFELKNTV